MAQDELGHARSTYPVFKQLGVDSDEDGFGGDKRLALLDDELPDWNAFIAANLLVDGVLTTFVASCVDTTLAPMAQRAKKILQEEGSHRAHGEAWARRLCAASRTATRSSRGCSRRGARRPLGRPDDDPSTPRVEAGEVDHGPARPPARGDARVAHRTARARGGRDRTAGARRATTGTRSGADGTDDLPVLRLGDVDRVAQWGGQIITAQWRCEACNSYFEAVREDFDDAPTHGGDRRRPRHRRRDLHPARRRRSRHRHRLPRRRAAGAQVAEAVEAARRPRARGAGRHRRRGGRRPRCSTPPPSSARSPAWSTTPASSARSAAWSTSTPRTSTASSPST